MVRLLSLAILLALAGCASRPIPRQVVFNEADYAQYAEPGTATIRGQAFLVQAGGNVVKAAGREIALRPKTGYSEEWYARHIINNETLEPGDTRILKYIRTVNADADGNFQFENVPAGEYYVTCFLTWGAYTGGYGLSPQGGWMVKRITVLPGSNIRVQLSELTSPH